MKKARLKWERYMFVSHSRTIKLKKTCILADGSGKGLVFQCCGGYSDRESHKPEFFFSRAM